MINQSARHIRGKIARHLASALSIALKVDVFGGKDMGEKLRNRFESFTKTLKTHDNGREKTTNFKKKRH